MKILQLEYFDAVCRNKSITKAATELFVSQPAISKSLIELESEYELKFFQRENNKLKITKEGFFFWESIKPILKNIEILKEELKILSKQQKSLNIGIPPMVGRFLLPNIFTKIYSNELPMELNIFEYGSIKTLQLLDENKIDLGFVINETDPLKDKLEKYDYLKLLETKLLFCVGRKHHLAKRKKINLAELKNIPLVLRGEGSFQALKIKESFETVGLEPNITLYTNQVNMVKTLLKNGQIGAFFIKEIVEEDQDIITIDLEQEINVNLFLIWKKNSILSCEIKKIIILTKLKK
ncbi:MAG: LysR family transcriptional regulator [Clostridium sp.]|uniref:LysR family transcriptional regulator n=1 Tax=Clostridium sp. TaxID=1506 RepID=UPI003F3CED33